MQGRKNISQKIFYQVCLNDLVGKDNFYRKLSQVLDLQFIYRKTAHYYGTEGQESIDPVVFVFSAKQQFNALNIFSLAQNGFMQTEIF